MGERRGVMGAPPWRAGASGAWRLGELTEGDEGPEDTADCLWAGGLGDFDFSLDFVRERFIAFLSPFMVVANEPKWC